MYQGKYPENGLPPGYNGTAYTSNEQEQNEQREPQSPPPPPEPETVVVNDNGAHGIFQGITEHLFSHSIDMEDLLIIGLTVLLINSGADSSLIIAMAMLFVMGL